MTDALKQAAQQALEAWQTSSYGQPSHHKAVLLAMTKLSAALAAHQPAAPQPAQPEPVLDERKSFEAWAESQFGPILRDPKLEYTYTDVRAGWRAWQARASQPVQVVQVVQVAQAVPQPVRVVMTDAARDVLAERQRQISAEGWTPEHDDRHGDGSMALAASCYACAGANLDDAARDWPWGDDWFKPTTARRNLIKAGALILAELERIDRAHGITKGGE